MLERFNGATPEQEVLDSWDPDADGLFGAVEVLIGADVHSSVFSSLQLIGFGCRSVTKVDTDDQGRMRPQALARALADKHGPKIVIAQAGHPGSTPSDASR